MAFCESLAGRIRDALARKKNIEEKKIFGGVGFLLNGNLLVGVRKDSLLVRLGPEQSDEALMKGGVVVALEGVENDDQLSGWIQRALKFAGSLSAK